MVEAVVRKALQVNLAEILLSQGLMTKDQMTLCEIEQQKTEASTEKTILEMKFATNASIAEALEAHYNVPFMALGCYEADPEVIKEVPERLARKYKFLPLFKILDSISVSIVNPRDLYGIDEIRSKLGCNVGITVTTEDQVVTALDKYYGSTGTMEDLTDLVDEIVQSEFGSFDDELEVEKVKEVNLETVSEEMLEKSPVVKLLNTILLRAIREGVSDIHIQHEEDTMLVRYRLDGVLYQASALPKSLRTTLVSRIKVVSGMNIAESRAPQDGRFNVKAEKRQYDFRVSTMPTVFGESVVMRVLDKSTATVKLGQLGFSEESLNIYQSLIDRPNGIILMTGPTGSGKTTTLYASLNKISSPDINIITVEDPVEYRLKYIRQTQINVKGGITFASAIRAILRQDPDVIMIGEMRDRETVEIAVQAAMTGHLVFSTLHTNSATGAISRLMDMGVEPFLIASSVIGVVAQRLVRSNCKHCTVNYLPGEDLLRNIGLLDSAGMTFSKGKGCDYCRHTGYKGRVGLYEILVIDNQIRDLIIKRESPHVIAEVAKESQNFRTLVLDGVDKVQQGLTSVEEVLSVANAA
jgi:type IV pilus assembly protein PilB